jgi:predicted N-acyltransferase
MSQLRIQHCESIAHIHTDDWNRLENKSGFTSSAWLQTVEQFSIQSVRPQFILAYADNKLVGAMILELVKDIDRENSVAQAILGGNRLGHSLFTNLFLPNLAAGVPHGYGGQLLVDSNGDAGWRAKIARTLVAEAEALSESFGAPLWFPNVLATDKLLLETLHQADYLSTRYLPLAEIAIDWDTFDDYVASLKHRSQNVVKDIRRERNRCRAAGVTFEEPSDLSNSDSKLVEMASETYLRHGNSRFPFSRGFFSALHHQLGPNFLVCLASKSGHPLGFVTMLSDGDTAWADSYGLDYAHPDSKFVYFNLVYQWPIRKAIELGLKRIVFGRGQYELKSRRGCTLIDSYLLVKPANWFGRAFYASLFRLVDRHYGKQVARELMT